MSDADRVSVLGRIVDAGSWGDAQLTDTQNDDEVLVAAYLSWHPPLTLAGAVARGREMAGALAAAAEPELTYDQDVAAWRRERRRANRRRMATVIVAALLVSVLLIRLIDHFVGQSDTRCRDAGGEPVHLRGRDLCLDPNVVIHP